MAVTAKYTEQVVFMVEPDVRAYLDEESKARGVALGVVARELFDEALGRREELKGE